VKYKKERLRKFHNDSFVCAYEVVLQDSEKNEGGGTFNMN
jgi:hypothetical protein